MPDYIVTHYYLSPQDSLDEIVGRLFDQLAAGHECNVHHLDGHVQTLDLHTAHLFDWLHEPVIASAVHDKVTQITRSRGHIVCHSTLHLTFIAFPYEVWRGAVLGDHECRDELEFWSGCPLEWEDIDTRNGDLQHVEGMGTHQHHLN